MFRAKANLKRGETLCVVGNTNRLGSGRIKRALELVTSPKEFPVWFNLEPMMLPDKAIVEYKYFIRSGGKFSRWEPFEGHRTILAYTEGSLHDIIIHDTVNVSENNSEGILPSKSINDLQKQVEAATLQAGSTNVTNNKNEGDDNDMEGEDSVITGLDSNSVALTFGSTNLNNIQPAPAKISPLPSPQISPHGSPSRDFTKTHGSDKGDRDPTRTPGSTASGSGSDFGGEELHLDGSDSIICVAFHLPIHVECVKDKNDDTKIIDWNVTWDADALLSRKKATQADFMRIVFVGTVKTFVPLDQEDIVAKKLERYHCVPVFLPPKLYHRVWHGYINTTLWTVFHNAADIYSRLPSLWWNGNIQEQQWEAYMDMNSKFAGKIVEVFCTGDTVWIQDIGLLILPSYLVRRIRQNIHIGMFIHKPFPSSEIFRTLSVREKLLRGMLNADHIGFHLYEYARHFLTCCRRILGLTIKYRPGGHILVEYQGRQVVVTVAHASIEPDVVFSRIAMPKTQEYINMFSKKFQISGVADNSTRNSYRKKLIVGIDRVERMCGLPIKLLAYRTFLEGNPQWVGRCVLIQYGIRCPERGDDFLDTQKRIKEEICKINLATTGISDGGDNPPIVYHEVDRVNVYERTALFQIGDIFLNTCVRQGLDLMPLEYCAIRVKKKNVQCGILAISEFASASRILPGAVVFNPFEADGVAQIIGRCLEMPEMETTLRGEQNMVWIQRNSTTSWAERVLTDLKRFKKERTSKVRIGYGFGLEFKMMGVQSDFSKLDHTAVVDAYRSSFNRVILLDVGGTITEAANLDPLSMYQRAKRRRRASKDESGKKDNESNTNATKTFAGRGEVDNSKLPASSTTRRPTDQVLNAITHMASDTTRNTVFLLSGEKKKILTHLLGGNASNIGLAAENGFTYKWNTLGSKWQMTNEMFDDSWKDTVKQIMQIYTMRTTGSYIDVKGSAVIWRFQDTDKDFGYMQAKELKDHLSVVLKRFPVQIITGKETVEVRPEGVDKGEIVLQILNHADKKGKNDESANCNDVSYDTSKASIDDKGNSNARSTVSFGEIPSSKSTPVDFILCIGDEDDDEPMFQKIHARYEERGLVPRQGPASAAGVMGMKVDKRHRQGDMQTPKHYKTISNGNTKTTEENIKESTFFGRKSSLKSNGADDCSGRSLHSKVRSGGSNKNLASLSKGSFNDLTSFGKNQRSESKESLSSSNSAYSSHKSNNGTRTKIFTATVGAKPSSARYFVHSSDDVCSLLESLAKVSWVSKLSARSRSMGDLKGLKIGGLSAFNIINNRGSNDIADATKDGVAVEPVTSQFYRSKPTAAPRNKFMGTENADSLASLTSFAQQRQLQRNKASASMVNLADMANKRVGLGQIMEEVDEMRKDGGGSKIASSINEYFNNLDDDEDEGGLFF
jgi:trehalose 6-phosphate synthase/phosphatase